MKIKLEFKKEDCWIGVYWKKSLNEHAFNNEMQWDIWICIIPMIPLHLTIIKPIDMINLPDKKRKRIFLDRKTRKHLIEK